MKTINTSLRLIQLHDLLKTIEELANCFAGLLSQLLEEVTGCKDGILGLQQICQPPPAAEMYNN